MVFMQDDWDPDWQSTSSSKVSYLVQRLKSLQEANIESGHFIDKERDTRDIEQPCPSLMCDSSALLLDCSRQSSESSKAATEKVLIFSQFLEHIHVIEQQVFIIYHCLGLSDFYLGLSDFPCTAVTGWVNFSVQLTFAGIKFAGHYSPMHSSNKVLYFLKNFFWSPSFPALLFKVIWILFVTFFSLSDEVTDHIPTWCNMYGSFNGRKCCLGSWLELRDTCILNGANLGQKVIIFLEQRSFLSLSLFLSSFFL